MVDFKIVLMSLSTSLGLVKDQVKRTFGRDTALVDQEVVDVGYDQQISANNQYHSPQSQTNGNLIQGMPLVFMYCISLRERL